MEAVSDFIDNLARSVFTHRALQNRFYDRWMTGPLDFQGMRTFARNYLARTVNTSTMVALSFLGTDDIVAKAEIVKNLHSEFGHGDPARAHITLLRSMLTDVLSRLQGAPFQLAELDRIPVLPTTARFITVQRELYTSKDEAAVLGTLLAQEWLAYSMLTRLYEGFRHYRPLFPSLDEFHEHCEYFYVHIGEAEKDHKDQAVRSANQVCKTEAQLASLQSGFNGFLGITADFWEGLGDAVSASRRAA